MNKFIYRMLCKNYEASSRSMLKEMRKVKSQLTHIDSAVRAEFNENLQMLRMFLDNHGILMPRPKWHYDDKDESTWLYTHRRDLNKNFHMLQGKRK